MEERTRQLETQIAISVAMFSVGDYIIFQKSDETGCTESTGDPIEVDLIGKIISIDGQHATVEHEYGTCSVWLAIAKRVHMLTPEECFDMDEKAWNKWKDVHINSLPRNLFNDYQMKVVENLCRGAFDAGIDIALEISNKLKG